MNAQRMIPRILIKDNTWNWHRKADEDLVASVREHGILNSLVVRPLINFGYELVAGARRLDAANRLGLTEVPCMVLNLDDRAALEITIIENLQRENLHPVAEAKAIATLISDGHTKEEVAARIGKTPAFVTRRVRLATLSEKIIEVAGDDLMRMSIRALELLATMPEPKQIEIFDGWGGISMDATDMAENIARESRVITGATFNGADETLVPEAGACATCQKRTEAEPLLFADLTALKTDDRCLDPECYARKADVHLARTEAALRAKFGEKLMLVARGLPYGVAGAAMRKRGVEQIGSERAMPCRARDEGSRPALVVSGKEAGNLMWVKSTEQKPTRSIDELRSELNERRLKRAGAILVDRVWLALERGEHEKVAQAIGETWSAIVSRAEEEIPEPKTWSRR